MKNHISSEEFAELLASSDPNYCLTPAAYVELKKLFNPHGRENPMKPSPEQFASRVIGEWVFFARCLRDGAQGWKPDRLTPPSLSLWRFYPQGLLWEERKGQDGQWFPYSVYRTWRELFIVRNPRPQPQGREERYRLAYLSRRFLWVYDSFSDWDSEDPPQSGLMFWRKDIKNQKEPSSLMEKT